MSTTNPLRDALDDLDASAIEPQRVIVLDEGEQSALLHALDYAASLDDAPAYMRLFARIGAGETYVNETDELVRVTLRKRRLEEEVRRCNRRIADLEPVIVEQWVEAQRSKDGHAPTGATLSMTRRVWAKLDVDTDGLDKAHADQLRADCKALAGAALTEVGLGDLVRPDFNLNTLSAVFREQIKAYDEQQRDLPEHERRPKAAQDFLPEALAGLLRLDDSPHITVRA
jgi:hypothetical protein